MTQEGFKRKLAAILSADVIGYSRLMRDDEEATVSDLTAHRVIITKIIQQHHGRVVDSPGDNILVEFASVVDAVNGAIKIQDEIKKSKTDIPEDRRMEFRIGINLGDVIEEEDRIYGDGVNIAARVEGLAAGGGISISGTVYEHIKDKLSLGYHYLGEQNVKNIPEPIQVYRLLTEPEAAGRLIDARRPRLRRWHLAVVAVAVLVFGITAIVSIWNFYFRSTPLQKVTAPLATNAISLANRASIAVLPFKNLSGNPEQEYFSDGITNDIITDLSKFRELLVIASNTVFTYKGRPVNVKDVSRNLGVQYVVEGSVQKSGDKVRINAQLINAATGHHLWAERYERDLKDLFSLQDEIVQTIVATLGVKIYEAERERAMRKDTDSLEAYDYFLRGWEHLNQRSRSANIMAQEMFQKAIEIDPRYANAYVALAGSYSQTLGYGWTEFPAQNAQHGLELLQKALSLDDSNSKAHALLGLAHIYAKEYDLAISELNRAIELNPNDAFSYRLLGTAMLFYGRPDDTILALEKALRFDPNISPSSFLFLGLGYYLRERYEDAIRTLKRGIQLKPDFADLHIALAAAYAQLGRIEDAGHEAQTVLRLHPFFEVDSYGTAFRNPEDLAKIIEGLRKAGLK